MKKLLFVAILFLTALSIDAQYTTPRWGTPPSGDNTGRVLTYAYQSKVYAASSVITANAYETTVKYGTLTGAISLTAGVTACHVGDKLNILFTDDGSSRVITFSTGFSSGGTLTMTASGKATVYFVFDGVGWFQLSGQNLVTGLAGAGSAAAPSISFTGQTDQGLYNVSATELGVTVGGVKAAGITTSGLNVVGTLTAAKISQPTITGVITGYTSSVTVTAAAVAGGVLSVTSGTLTLTLPTATQMATQLGATAGNVFDFVLLNAGAGGTATIAVGSGIVASGFPSSNTLTLANSATIGVATFRLTFISATAATLTRIS